MADGQPRICGDQVLLTLALFLGALQMEPTPGAATLDDVTEAPTCTLQQHDAGEHHGVVLDLDGPDSGAVWAVWTDIVSPRLVVLPDCPASRADGMRSCCQYLDHPGGHTWQVHDPLQAAAASAVARMGLKPRTP
jgi:hypothetical protein